MVAPDAPQVQATLVLAFVRGLHRQAHVFQTPTGWGINWSAETPGPSQHAFWQTRLMLPKSLAT